NFTVLLAKDGKEALALLAANTVDLVLTDTMMPVMDGLKLCAQIKQNVKTSHLPVIMISAKSDLGDQLNAFGAGADDYLVKPFAMPVLEAKVRNTLRTHHRLHDKVSGSLAIVPEQVCFNALDEQILTKAVAVVRANIDNPKFSTDEFARAMNMSRSNLHLKLKTLTGESALDFVHKVRFEEACKLLRDGRWSISEISDKVGFSTPSYFATSFKKYMGCLPTEYQNRHTEQQDKA
ncbi:MAG: response regulator, partial [Tidjanibacter sp.]|nr:response regulator [Tidjanibacter sp.]